MRRDLMIFLGLVGVAAYFMQVLSPRDRMPKQVTINDGPNQHRDLEARLEGI